jgi:hypothetical protein
MERAMSEHLDGTAGFGRYRGASIRELEGMLEKCRREGGMRGVSAVLRIAREQLDARGGLGSYPWLAAICLVAAAGIWFFPYRDGPLKDWRMQGVIGSLVLFALFGWTSVSTFQDRKKALYQEGKIRVLSLDALVDIVAQPSFEPKPLDYTQRLTLERIMKKEKRQDSELKRLLSA